MKKFKQALDDLGEMLGIAMEVVCMYLLEPIARSFDFLILASFKWYARLMWWICFGPICWFIWFPIQCIGYLFFDLPSPNSAEAMFWRRTKIWQKCIQINWSR